MLSGGPSLDISSQPSNKGNNVSSMRWAAAGLKVPSPELGFVSNPSYPRPLTGAVMVGVLGGGPGLCPREKQGPLLQTRWTSPRVFAFAPCSVYEEVRGRAPLCVRRKTEGLQLLSCFLFGPCSKGLWKLHKCRAGCRGAA